MHVAPQRPHKSEAGIRNASVSLFGFLDDNELLQGTPTIIEQITTDLIITNGRINTVPITINNEIVLSGHAVLCSIAGGLKGGSPYKIKITVMTNASTPQTIIGFIILNVVADA